MKRPVFRGVLCSVTGLFFMVCAIFDWDLLSNWGPGRKVLVAFDDDGERIFHGMIGGVCVIVGILIATGGVKVGKE